MRLLDLFCGAGGAAMGYHRAGFEVTGVDIVYQRRHPFAFIQADAFEYLAAHGHEYDVIHASPPCQFASHITPDKSKHPNLIPATREALQHTGKPYVIENVYGARKHLVDPIMLCGTQFDLKVYRHRFFETYPPLLFQPWHIPHDDSTPGAGHGLSPKGSLSVTGGGHGITEAQLEALRLSGRTPAQATHRFISPKGFISVVGHFSHIGYARFAMGIEWMVGKELKEAIPPAYTEWIGRQLLNAMGADT